MISLSMANLPSCKYGPDHPGGSSHPKSLIFFQALSKMSLGISVYMQQVLQLVNNVEIIEPP